MPRPSILRRRSELLLVLLAGLVLPLGGRARADEKGSGLERVHDCMRSFVDQNEIAGAVTVVGRKDGIAHHTAVGKLDLESGKVMPKDAIFRIASMTKPITAMGIMILVDE